MKYPGVVAVIYAGLLCNLAHIQAQDAPRKELPPAAQRPIVFSKDIKPLVESSCVNCHGKGRAKGGFQLDTRETVLAGGNSGAVVTIGKSDKSLLIDLVAGVDPDNVMPKKGKRLTAEQIGLLRAWVDQGLPWESGISFAKQPPRNLSPRMPESMAKTGIGNPVDGIIKQYFAAQKVASPGLVNDRVFARRAYLDIVGLLPSASELRKFEEDKSPGKRAGLVERLLGRDDDYAQHWLTFWNDLLRNDYRGTGYIDGGRKQITAWLYSALRTNLPYDKFVGALINPTAENEGFTKGIVWRGVVNASQTSAMQAAQNISQVFMGVNLKCASCHDSFINDWKLSDAYGLAAVYSDKPLEMFLCDKPTGQTVAAAFIYPELGQIDAEAEKQTRLARLAEIITSGKDGRLPRTIVNRFWERFLGRGLVEPVDDMEQPSWNTDLLDYLAEDLVAHNYDLKHLIERIVTSEAYQMPAVNLAEAPDAHFVFRGPSIRRLSAEQFRDAVGQLTDVWFDKADYAASTNRIRASLVAADPLAVALGRPNREQVLTVRPTTATTLQALELTNGKTLAHVLEKGAEKLASQTSEPEQLTEQLYASAFGRNATAKELELGRDLIGSPATTAGIEDLLWSLVMLPEFQLIY